MPSQPQGASRFHIFSWTLFDFANTAFYVIILTVAYPLYFKEIVVRGSGNGDFLWGATFSASMLVVALLSPILGAAADQGAGKKRFLLIFTLLCVFSTSGLFFVGEGMILWAMLLVVLANIGFEAGLVFYDAFLPELTTPASYGRVSGYGFAMGYVGSLTTLLVAFPLLRGGLVPENLLNVRASFVLAAGLFLVFSLPLFLFLRDRQVTGRLRLEFIRGGIQQVKTTFNGFKKYRNVGRFLLAYFLYADAINTVIIFSSIFARQTLQFDLQEIVFLFAIIQTSAMIGAALLGIAADRFGQKRTLSGVLVLWLLIVVAAFFVEDKTAFFIVGALAGIALGSSQSTSRSLMALISPQEKKTEFFGFYSFFGKASAILGPLVFGVVSSLATQRAAILSIGAFFLVGLIILRNVEEKPFTENPEHIPTIVRS
jgi:UMF1 family MFS transporter